MSKEQVIHSMETVENTLNDCSKLISNVIEFEDNLRQVENYLDSNNQGYKDLIASCQWFVKYRTTGGWHFAPCRFVAYKGITITTYNSHKKEFHIVKSRALLKSCLMLEPIDSNTENDFGIFCEKYRIQSQKKNLNFLQYNPMYIANDDEGARLQSAIEDASTLTIEELNGLRQNPASVLGTNVNRVARDSRIAKTALVNASFKCEVDSSHTTFKTPAGFDYMEGHHLIPLTPDNVKHFWTDFSTNLDCVENIVCLCPTCHRHLHFGDRDERRKILAKLLEKRKEGHSLFTSITIDKLEKYYQ